jgi:HSP20 family protein
MATDSRRRQEQGPFAIMRQGLDEMERWIGNWGRTVSGDWSPAIETFQRGNDIVIRADVPGMTRQDLQVEVGDDAVTIRGERKQDRTDERDGMFWTERSYGSFTRVIPLPAGAMTDSAKATFTNGVLEIVMPAPSAEARRGRKLDISGS